MITFIEKIMHPKTDEINVAKHINIINTDETFLGRFFVVGRTNTGGRYYSETVKDYDYAYHLYCLYSDLVDYFGGGIVELYCMTPNGCNRLIYKNIC